MSISTLRDVEDGDSIGGRVPAGTIEAGAIRGASSLRTGSPQAIVCDASFILPRDAEDVKLTGNHESRRLKGRFARGNKRCTQQIGRLTFVKER
jgi:hypothetical protein